MKFSKVFLILFLAIFTNISNLAFGAQNPEEAKKELERMNITYSTDSFIKAARDGNAIVVKLFLASNMNSNSKDDKYGATALDYALSKGHTDIAKHLIERGALINNKGKKGSTILFAMAGKGNYEVVKFCLDNGSEINMKNEFGNTALHFATIRSHINIVELLVNRGADINAKNNYGQTPLDFALNNGSDSIAQFLQGKGATPATEQGKRAEVLASRIKGDLTRENANSILSKQYPLVITATMYVPGHIQIFNPGGGVGPKTHHNIGFDYFKNNNIISESGKNITINEPYKQYLVEFSKGAATFTIGEIVFGEVTGIRTLAQNQKIVEFNERIIPNKVGRAFFNSLTERRAARFELYDDGWRFQGFS